MSHHEYAARINRVQDHIDAHLTEDLALAELARVASFSPYHFHRVFAAMVGETLGRYIQRLRLEKAASWLLYHPRKSVTEVALDCGFSSSATFARAFRAAFGMSASQWRQSRGGRRNGGDAVGRNLGKADRNGGEALRSEGKEALIVSAYLDPNRGKPRWRIEMKGKSNLRAEVEVKEMPELWVAYLRHVGPYQGDEQLFRGLWERMCKWAVPRGLFNPPETQTLTVYHDDPEITAEEKLRLDVCISVPEDIEVDGEIGKMKLPGGPYAVAHFEIRADQYGEAWNAVFGGWLPESGYQPDDRPCLELCHNNPDEHPEGKHIVDICVPVKPL